MVEITLFEIHLDGARIDADAEATANAPLSGLSGLLGRGKGESESSASNPGPATETEVEVEAEAEDDTEGSGPSVGKLLLATIVLAVVAALARRVLGGEDESIVEDVADADIASIDVGE